MGEKHEVDIEKVIQTDEKSHEASGTTPVDEEHEEENSKIDAVRLDYRCRHLPVLLLPCRVRSGTFSIYFVNLATYAMGTAMAKVLPKKNITIGSYSMSLNPGPFNIKEHAVIGIAVSTAATSAYAIDILTATDLFLKHRINAFGSFILILTTQCLGYGMAGVLRKYLGYPAKMVWWSNLVQIVFYNAMHNTDEFKTKKMIRRWSYMKYF
ncbi:hypothetical protein BGX29_002230 [Mortierella sp. GBA35]|nr:hypothetical protein BGX29_002230 [Mortierella sp. GBA35]